MELFDRLRHVALQAQLEDDLPDALAARIFRIADDPDRYGHLTEEIRELITQVSLYDTFGQTGYIGWGTCLFSSFSEA